MRLKDEMRSECVMLEMRKRRWGKKGRVSTIYLSSARMCRYWSKALWAWLHHPMLAPHWNGRSATPLYTGHSKCSDLLQFKVTQPVPGLPYSIANALNHLSGQHFRKISLVAVRMTGHTEES